LGVAHVVEGTVQRSANRLRVSAQLIDARNDTHLWAEHYDRDIADVFAIQSEIAQQIAEQLRARLSPEEKAAMGEEPTTDLRAYELYTEARAILIWNDPAGAERSVARKIELLEQATQRDPNFALAYCALVKAQCDFYDISLKDSVHLEAADKALDALMRIRPDLGDTHRELGRYYLYLGDYSRASGELTIARRTLPNDSEAFRIAGEIDRQRNRWEDALRNFIKAYELDPRNGEILHHTRLTYHLMRKYDDEQQFLDKSAFAREPEYPAWLSLYLAEIKLDQGDPAGAHAILAQSPRDFAPTVEWWIYRFSTALCLRDYDEASQILAATPPSFGPRAWHEGIIARSRGDKQKAQQAFLDARSEMEVKWANKTRDAFYLALLAKIDAGLGRKEEAIDEGRRAVDLMPISKDSAAGPPRLRDLALVYAWTGERDLAIEQLQRLAKIPGGPSYGDLRFNPIWDSLRDDARFEKMLAELKPKTVSAAR
jgi:tetratricopeptide (TPR) repeat protein